MFALIAASAATSFVGFLLVLFLCFFGCLICGVRYFVQCFQAVGVIIFLLIVVELSNDESMENRKVSWVDIVKKGENHK